MDSIEIKDYDDLKKLDLDELERIENKIWKYDRIIYALIKIKKIEKNLKDDEIKRI